VIVGTASAGAVPANRLGADPSATRRISPKRYSGRPPLELLLQICSLGESGATRHNDE